MSIDLHIDMLTHGGRGLGRHQGKAVFVPLAVPGDRVRVKLVSEKPRYAVGELVEILTPSADRRIPPCPHFGACGGCQWQMLPYAVQCQWKERIFRDMLLRERLILPEALQPLVPAPDALHYRNRAQFKCRQTQQGFVAGFYRPGSHYVEDVSCCHLVEPGLQAIFEGLKPRLAQSPAPHCIPQCDLAIDDAGAVQLVMHVLPEGQEDLKPWLQETAEALGVAAGLQCGRKQSLELIHGDGSLEYRVGTPATSLQVRAGGFAQVNSRQNRRLVDDLVELAGLRGSERVLDLFCGMGNFSLPLARSAAAVVGVEDYAPSIEDAGINARRNALANARFLAEDAATALNRLSNAGERFDLVVLDPPRTGCHALMRPLLEASPDRILYVSCDPASLARDLKPLVHNGYRIVSSRPYDLFPQTWHIESMTLLERD